MKLREPLVPRPPIYPGQRCLARPWVDPEPIACQYESTLDFLSADFADERRWGESQRRSVAGSIGGFSNP